MAYGEVPVVKMAQVISVEDYQGGDRIKVKLYPEDATKQNSEIPYAFPLLPKMLHVKPLVGETVCIINAIANNGDSQRYYIGPVISQQNHMEGEPLTSQAKSMFIGSVESPDKNPTEDPNTYGAFPNNEDIDIIGRRGAEVQLKSDEARIKAGVRLADEKNRRKIYFNTKSPSFLKLKFHRSRAKDIIGKTIGDEGYQSTATLVADKIFLLGNSGKGANGKNDTFKTTEVNYENGKIDDQLISDKELALALENAHRIPYGDVLVRYLLILTKAFIEHSHDYATLRPNPIFTNELILEKEKLLDNNEMLSDNVRIN